MTVIGIGFNKISMERFAPVVGKININNNATVKDIDKMELNVGNKKQNALKFTFEFKASYEPNLAHITLEGEVVWLEKESDAEKILKDWKKDKKIPKEIMTPVINAILAKSNIEALVLSRELNLPPPIPLPKVEAKE